MSSEAAVKRAELREKIERVESFIVFGGKEYCGTSRFVSCLLDEMSTFETLVIGFEYVPNEYKPLINRTRSRIRGGVCRSKYIDC